MGPDSELMIRKLSDLVSLLDYGPVLATLRTDGTLSALCRASLLLTFMCSALSMVEQMILNRGALDPGRTIRRLLTHVVILVVLFGNPLVFQTLINAPLSLLKGLNDWAFKETLTAFQADFRFALATVAGKAPDGVSFFSPVLFDAPMDVLVLSVSFHLVLVLFYVLVSYPPLLVVIGFLAGPILAPFSLLTPFSDIGKKWVAFLAAAALFPFFIGIGLMVLVDTSLFKAFATMGWDGILLPAIIAVVVAIGFMIGIPIIVAFLFAVPALNILSRVFSVVSGLVGLLPIFAKTMALFRATKKAAKVSS